MRARLSALLFLVLMIAIPGLVYWYFFMKNTASVEFIIADGVEFTVVLDGDMQNESLPLADNLIHIERTCIGRCRIEPIAPIAYTLTLSSTGKTSISDTLEIGIGEDISRIYTLTDDIVIVPVDMTLRHDDTLGNVLLANAQKKDTSRDYLLIGVDRDNTVYADRRGQNTRDIGILTLDGFAPKWKVPEGVGELSLDITGEYFIASLYSDKSILITRDFTRVYELPISGVLSYIPGREEKILTNSGVLLGIRSAYGENPRFSDWIDVSDTMRIGYIDGDDATRLALSGQTPGTPLLLIYNRETHNTSVLRKGLDIVWMFSIGDVPVFLDSAGKVWEIQYKK